MRLGIDRQRCCAMVQYDSMDSAKEALNAVKGTYIKNSRKLMVRAALEYFSTGFYNESQHLKLLPHMEISSLTFDVVTVPYSG